MGGIKFSLCVAAAVSAVAACPAAAQTFTTSGAQFNAGYGRVAGQESQPATQFGTLGSMNSAMTTTLANGATTLILSGAGAAAAFGSGVTTIGSGLTVVTQSRQTTTVINFGASASASAAASVSTELNGTIDLDGPH